jgi:nickel/cobalt transporter (NicO) family protein
MNELQLLLLSAVSLGFIHTLLGPDHYLPFIVLSKARKWSQAKTLWITFISGVGHVLGSVVLGIAGIAMGISLNILENIEASRGELVGWLLIAFGLGYTVYGVVKFIRKGGHTHLPSFLVPKKIKHLQHLPETEEENQKKDTSSITPWILFLIFVFGPCEVLIPLLIFPAAEFNAMGIALVSLVFGLSTIATMLAAVFIGFKGTSLIRFKKGERYWHMIAGLIILFAGIGMQFMGW